MAKKKRDRLHLDVRRQKVLALLVKGLTYPQIAEELGIHKQAVYRDVVWLRKSRRADIELIRVFNWDEIMKIIPGLTKLQQAKLRIEIQRILEPKKMETKLETKGDLKVIYQSWRPGQEKDDDDNDGDQE